MSLQTEMVGTHEKGHKVAVTVHDKEDVPAGAIVYTEPYRTTVTKFDRFTNDDVGVGMNVDAAFGGSPDIVHNGLDSVAWTGSNVIGGKANFSSGDRSFSGSLSVKVDNPALNDVWQFDKGSDLSVASHVAITFHINIDKDWSGGDSVSLYCYDTGISTMIGSTVLIEDYINEFEFDTWQTVSIPFADLGLVSTDFDSIRMSLSSKAGGPGKAPKFYIDDMQVEQSGTPFEFKTNTPLGKKYFVRTLRVTLTDAHAGTLNNGTMPALSYDKLLSVGKLSNGIVLSAITDGIATFSVSLTCLGDFFNAGFSIVDTISDGTNTMLVLETQYLDFLIIEGGRNSYISIKINDDLSGLLGFRAVARGIIEV